MPLSDEKWKDEVLQMAPRESRWSVVDEARHRRLFSALSSKRRRRSGVNLHIAFYIYHHLPNLCNDSW